LTQIYTIRYMPKNICSHTWNRTYSLFA
jgi:hypothetical protein